jgi:uncharacterized membrane protein YedE/YeeE
MTIDWNHFTLWHSLTGGVLIGLAAAVMILFNGRIAGISGIIGGLMAYQPDGERLWRWLFLAGLLLSVPLWRTMALMPEPVILTRAPLLIFSGLLVGLGTRYAAGCTSGHGVCGISRGSPRSLVATAAFMLSGFLVVGLMRHIGAIVGR